MGESSDSGDEKGLNPEPIVRARFSLRALFFAVLLLQLPMGLLLSSVSETQTFVGTILLETWIVAILIFLYTSYLRK